MFHLNKVKLALILICFFMKIIFFVIKFSFIANLSTPVNVATFRSCYYYVQDDTITLEI